MSESTPALRVEGLWKVFGPRPERALAAPYADLDRAELRARTGCVAAVRDVSFDVAPGEVFVVMGLSGSGKSTLVRCLTRLVEPTAGAITLDGHDVVAASDARLRELRRSTVSMVFQHFGLLPHRRVLDNVGYGLKVRGVRKDERRTRAQELVDLVGLAGYEQAFPDQLSGGMQQRVGLARALANDPAVLLFDEPFSALDPLIRRDMQTEVARLQAELHKTIVFVTHDLREALRLGDRILIMRDGEVAQIGTPAEIVAAPADDHVRDFVRDVPRAQVLTLEHVMRPPRPDDPSDGPVMGPGTIVGHAARAALTSAHPLRVVRDGELVGIVDDDAILGVLVAGEDGPASGLTA